MTSVNEWVEREMIGVNRCKCGSNKFELMSVNPMIVSIKEGRVEDWYEESGKIIIRCAKCKKEVSE